MKPAYLLMMRLATSRAGHHGLDALRPPLAFAAGLASPASFDRFRCACPAEFYEVGLYDPALGKNNGDDGDGAVWAATYRTSGNYPTVLREDFMAAMTVATTAPSEDPAIELVGPLAGPAPVALARLRPSGNTFIMDSLRCKLKKEDTDPSCDGGSEHTEALAAAIDEIITQHLKNLIDHAQDESKPTPVYGGSLRAKATLVSGKLLEDRGFREVRSLGPDMATHTSDYRLAMDCYAGRAADFGTAALSLSSTARSRTMNILMLLGKLEEVGGDKIMGHLDDLGCGDGSSDGSDDEYDPFAGNPFGGIGIR